MPINIAVFLSGTGSNFKSIASAIERGELDATITLVISNRSTAPGLEAAQRMGFNTAVFNRKEYESGADFANDMLSSLLQNGVNLIALCGYLRKIPPKVVNHFKERIVNVHPALLPKFGGKGMYGMNVHRAVIAAGEKESGVTIHYVDALYDNGEIVDQQIVPVFETDTAENLAAKILKIEHKFYPQVLQKLVKSISKRYDEQQQ